MGGGTVHWTTEAAAVAKVTPGDAELFPARVLSLLANLLTSPLFQLHTTLAGLVSAAHN